MLHSVTNGQPLEETNMKHHEQAPVTEHENYRDNGDSTADAIAAMVIILCLVAMGIFWVSGL
jgi:hypothetical protein